MPFGVVDGALARMHDVDDSRRSAFQARLKNYLRLGLLPNVQAGRGKAARYLMGDVLKLAVALELNELGLTPERAVTLVTELGLYTLARAVKAALETIPTTDVVLFCDPSALEDLRPAQPGDRAVSSFYYVDKGQMHRHIDSWLMVRSSRMSMLNISKVLDALENRLAASSEYSEDQLRSAMLAWAIETDRS